MATFNGDWTKMSGLILKDYETVLRDSVERTFLYGKNWDAPAPARYFSVEEISNKWGFDNLRDQYVCGDYRVDADVIEDAITDDKHGVFVVPFRNGLRTIPKFTAVGPSTLWVHTHAIQDNFERHDHNVSDSVWGVSPVEYATLKEEVARRAADGGGIVHVKPGTYDGKAFFAAVKEGMAQGVSLKGGGITDDTEAVKEEAERKACEFKPSFSLPFYTADTLARYEADAKRAERQRKASTPFGIMAGTLVALNDKGQVVPCVDDNDDDGVTDDVEYMQAVAASAPANVLISGTGGTGATCTPAPGTISTGTTTTNNTGGIHVPPGGWRLIGYNTTTGAPYDPTATNPNPKEAAERISSKKRKETPLDLEVPKSFRVDDYYGVLMRLEDGTVEADTEAFCSEEGAKERARQLMYHREDVASCATTTVWRRA